MMSPSSIYGEGRSIRRVLAGLFHSARYINAIVPEHEQESNLYHATTIK